MFKRLINKLRAMLRQSVLSEIKDESNSNILIANAENNDGNKKVSLYMQYGTFGTPMDPCYGLLLALNGNVGESMALPHYSTARIMRETKPGEFGVGNFVTKANVFFDEEGNINVSAPDGDLNIDINGNVNGTITGDVSLNVDGNINLQCKKKITIKADEDINIESGGNMTLKASKINLN